MDQLGLYNLALSGIGGRAKLTDVNEVRREAELCNLWYLPTVYAVLRAAFWPCAKGVARLALIKERDTSANWVTGDPDPGWRYAYSAPSDMLRPRHITDYARFEQGIASNSKAIMTDKEDALFVYTKKQTNVPLWDETLQMAVAKGLAANVVMGLTGKLSRAKMAAEEANEIIMQARAESANEDESKHETMPEWFTARGYGATMPPQRYIYPYGPLLAVQGTVSVE